MNLYISNLQCILPYTESVKQTPFYLFDNPEQFQHGLNASKIYMFIK